MSARVIQLQGDYDKLQKRVEELSDKLAAANKERGALRDEAQSSFALLCAYKEMLEQDTGKPASELAFAKFRANLFAARAWAKENGKAVSKATLQEEVGASTGSVTSTTTSAPTTRT